MPRDDRSPRRPAALVLLAVVVAALAPACSPGGVDAVHRSAEQAVTRGSSYRYEVDSPRTGAMSATGTWSTEPPSSSTTVTARDDAARSAMGALGSPLEVRTTGASTWFRPDGASPVGQQLGATPWLAQTDGDVAAVAVDVPAVLGALADAPGARPAKGTTGWCRGVDVDPSGLLAAIGAPGGGRNSAARACLDGGRLSEVRLESKTPEGPVTFRLLLTGAARTVRPPSTAEVFSAPAP